MLSESAGQDLLSEADEEMTMMAKDRIIILPPEIANASERPMPRRVLGACEVECVCGFVHSNTLLFCPMCKRPRADMDELASEAVDAVMKDVDQQHPSLQLRFVDRGFRGRNNKERMRNRKFLKRSKLLGYASISERFEKDQQFKKRMLENGWSPASTARLDVWALEDPQHMPVSLTERHDRWGRYVEVEEASEGRPLPARTRSRSLSKGQGKGWERGPPGLSPVEDTSYHEYSYWQQRGWQDWSSWDDRSWCGAPSSSSSSAWR